MRRRKTFSLRTSFRCEPSEQRQFVRLYLIPQYLLKSFQWIVFVFFKALMKFRGLKVWTFQTQFLKSDFFEFLDDPQESINILFYWRKSTLSIGTIFFGMHSIRIFHLSSAHLPAGYRPWLRLAQHLGRLTPQMGDYDDICPLIFDSNSVEYI